MAGIGTTNAHRLMPYIGSQGKPIKPWWYCSAPDCDWHPAWPASVYGTAREQFTRHLYELVPKGGHV